MKIISSFFIAVGAVMGAAACSGGDTTGTDQSNISKCVENVLCPVGEHWDSKACKCEPGVCDPLVCPLGKKWNESACACECTEMVMCIVGDHWDPETCTCIKNCNTEMVVCVNGGHWDTTLCRCVE